MRLSGAWALTHFQTLSTYLTECGEKQRVRRAVLAHLVGDGNADTAEAGEGIQEGPHLIHQQGHKHGVQAGRCQSCIVQRGAAAVRHRIAHNPKNLR